MKTESAHGSNVRVLKYFKLHLGKKERSENYVDDLVIRHRFYMGQSVRPSDGRPTRSGGFWCMFTHPFSPLIEVPSLLKRVNWKDLFLSFKSMFKTL